MSPAELLYVHPAGLLNDLVVPAGVLTCVNSVSVPKLGRYSFEVTDAEIVAAPIIAIDLHWALAIPGFEQLVHHIRSLNREARIVVGGVTAGHYPLELLERYPIDFVLRGDSETSFVKLVHAVLEGRTTEGIPNTFRKDQPLPRHHRMSDAEFDATDCITADWFPTFQKVSNWDSVAFPQGRMITVSRGCAFSCPECYGSYASTYGKGYLLRSPAGVARLLRQAQQQGMRNIRLFLGKSPANWLSSLLRGLADEGPFCFSSGVGLYLCTPPSVDDLELLDRTFENEIHISMIPPHEHVPELEPRQLETQQRGWLRVANQVSASQHLNLDAWTTARGDFERTRSIFESVAGSRRVKVSFGAVWSVTRPTENGEKHRFDTVRAAVEPLWTFYASRLLSPALASLLEPFQFLDELDVDPATLPAPDGPLRPFFDAMMASWRRDHLPTLPALRLALVPLRLRPGVRTASTRFGARLSGELTCAENDQFEMLENGVPQSLQLTRDHEGVRLTASVSCPPGTSFLAFVPEPLAGAPADLDWVRALAATGMTGMQVRDPSPTSPIQIDVLLRMQEVFVYLQSPHGPLRGRADLRLHHPVTASAVNRVRVGG